MSNLLVQNIKHTNGTTSMVVNSSGHVATDTVKGNTTAGSINVVGEGGSNTTNLQQGLCKTFILFNGESTPASRGSFNVTSISDGGTGLYTLNLTNAFNDGNHADVSSNSNGFCITHNTGSPVLAGASTSHVNSKNAAGSDIDSGFISTACHGDLA